MNLVTLRDSMEKEIKSQTSNEYRRGARRERAPRSAEDSATPGFLNTLKKRKNPTVAFEPSERQVDRVVVGPVFCFSFSCFVRLKLVSLILLGQM